MGTLILFSTVYLQSFGLFKNRLLYNWWFIHEKYATTFIFFNDDETVTATIIFNAINTRSIETNLNQIYIDHN